LLLLLLLLCVCVCFFWGGEGFGVVREFGEQIMQVVLDQRCCILQQQQQQQQGEEENGWRVLGVGDG